MAIAYYGAEISPNQLETNNGFLICKNVPIARIGEQVYTARDLMMDGDPSRPVTVYRDAADVFDPAALASFEGVVVTDGHPGINVDAGNYGAFARGHAQNVRRVGEHVVADLHIYDQTLISDIRNKVKLQVSCGYNCDWSDEAGRITQKRIRGNHVAIVPQGRAGATVAIKDAARKESKPVNKLKRAILQAFGSAVQDATPDELAEMVEATSDALDAVPADKAPEAEPADPTPKKEESESMDTKDMKAEDVEVERAPKGDDLGTKLDKLIEMMGEMMKLEKAEEKKLSDEGDLDELIKTLAGEEGDLDDAKAETLPLDGADDMAPAAKDAAMHILRSVRPAVAEIADAKQRAAVVDALTAVISDSSKMGDIVSAVAGNARKLAQDAANADPQARYTKLCDDQQAVYRNLNPHTKKEG